MDVIRHRESIELIREVFHYSHLFQGKTFVIKVDYPVVRTPVFSQFVRDLVLLHSVGIRIVIVPGSRERIDEILEQFHENVEVTGFFRISPFTSMPFIKMAAFDVTNQFMTEFSANQVTAVVGNWVKARGMGVIDGVDYQASGKVHRVDEAAIKNLLDEGHIPIIPCIGWNQQGKPYNLSSNELAFKVAQSLGAEKLFFVNTLDGFFQEVYRFPAKAAFTSDNRCARLTLPQTEWMLENNSGTGLDLGLHQLELALEACRGGVERVHIVDGRIEGVILKEIFSNLGIGTMVYSDQYERIRKMEAGDIPMALRLMDPLVEEGLLIPRTSKQIQDNLEDYVVYDIDGTVFGLAALHYHDEKNAEIAALAVSPYLNLTGIGRGMVSYLMERAKEKSLEQVFVLTTQASDWFESQGFKPSEVEALPEAKRKSYDSKRNSRVLVKKLRESQ